MSRKTGIPPEGAASLAARDKAHAWHPFTQMRDWCAPGHEPLVLVSGHGALLRDSRGNEYLDGNSSIWTNIHGHNHPAINAAIREQLERVAHTSFLGFTHPPAIELAERLASLWPDGSLTRVFFSDNGSTAIEAALKMSLQFWQLRGEPQRRNVIAFENAYHGDTLGASSLGGLGVFNDRFSAWHFPVKRIASVTELDAMPEEEAKKVTAVVIEPLVQGAAGIRLWPQGMLAALRAWCDRHRVLLIADEVLTGFGRTGSMFACQRENVVPDILALAKGLTGGYLPLAATLVTEEIFEAFLGRYEEMKTFFYGHSYTANPLGCAAALASLRVFEEERVLEQVAGKIALLSQLLSDLRRLPHVADVRQCGLIAGIELRQTDGEPFDWRLQTGANVCAAARQFGLLTRPIRDVIVLMPPLCVSHDQLRACVDAIARAITAVLQE